LRRLERNAGPSQKKTPDLLLAQNQEIEQLINHFSAKAPDGQAVAELEPLLRAAIFKPANEVVGYLLQMAADRIDAAYQPKPGECCKGKQSILVQGMFGWFGISRDYYYHEGKKQGHYPADDALGLEGTTTPALARLTCLVGAAEPGFEQAQNQLKEVGGIEVSGRQVQRMIQRVGGDAQAWQERQAQPGTCDAPIMYISGDGTGVPMRQEELEGRKGKQSDGSSRTRQAYLGCVFTQHRCDDEGHPVRDWQSTTYISSFGTINEFGPALRQEALRRGMGSVKEVVLLIDGAEGLEKMGEVNFKDAVQIVDFYHAVEHAGKVTDALHGKDHPDRKKLQSKWAKRLLRNGVENLIQEAREQCAGKSNAPAVEKELGYFMNNVDRMKYGTFRKKGYFIGSGVVEAGCKTIIGSRCKQSGMHWSRVGAEKILALRCISSSHRLDQFWRYRLNNHAAANDILPLAA